ncbi:NAD(P)H-binding protein [Chloroflexia bacterium SDU3-3]|nr:NAD(P)H-binding protein [Chloroflexia bacterium SDU3-3]
MKIVIIGGTGLIGSRLAGILRQQGHEVLAASRASGVNALTGEGLAAALDGAQVVVDVMDTQVYEPQALKEFFTTTSQHLLAAEAAAGVRHHIALSIVGVDGLPGNSYFAAKVAQEELIRAASTPYTIVRATQFFEFLGGIADASTVGQQVIVSTGLAQPIAADDVAAALAEVALAAPAGGIVEVAGPEARGLDAFVRDLLAARGDARAVVGDPQASYFGAPLGERSIIPAEGSGARIAPTRFAEWLRR